jgi:hypothetical protein
MLIRCIQRAQWLISGRSRIFCAANGGNTAGTELKKLFFVQVPVLSVAVYKKCGSSVYAGPDATPEIFFHLLCQLTSLNVLIEAFDIETDVLNKP